MHSYDPLAAPDPQDWLALDEQERISLVEQYHRRNNVRLPSVKVHSAFHVIAENQIALGDEMPVAAKLQQLMQEGLDRHEAVHAIASVASRLFYHTMKQDLQEDLNQWYAREIEKLTKKTWEEAFADDEG